MENKSTTDKDKSKFKDHLSMVFISVGIISFALGAAVNFLILKKNIVK